MRWEYEAPDHQLIVGDGTILWIYQPEDKQAIKAPLGEMFQATTPVSFLAGLAVLLWCVRDFYVAGKGTLAPWDPPRHLVRVGLYRYSRNPMYVGVLLILTGWATSFRTPTLAIYAVVVAILFHLRVLAHEEPWLARTFPGEWPAYRSRVPRWLIRVP